LQTGTSAASRWLSYVGLEIGVIMLLCSVQMFVNIQDLFGGNVIRKNGYDFISITKTISNETMDNPDKNVFHDPEIAELKKQPFIAGVAPLVSNEFHVQLTAGGILKTDLFLESLENEFIDTVPPSFRWEEGQMTVPVIIGSDFLEAYNVFAPGQGLPQISQATAMSIPVIVSCYGKGKLDQFQGRIVAFSDRINSVLVPKTFLDWANRTFGELRQTGASRLFIKTRDANDPELLRFLDQKKYNVNKEKTKFGREKRVIQGVLSGLGVFGLLVVVMALMLFSFYLQLVIARSKDNLQLLLLLGYSPGWLGKNLSRQFVPVYILIVLTALLLTQGMQWVFHHFAMYDRTELHTMVNWIVIVLAAVLVLLSIFTNYRLVRKLLRQLSNHG
jgi:hypothetical protein